MEKLWNKYTLEVPDTDYAFNRDLVRASLIEIGARVTGNNS